MKPVGPGRSRLRRWLLLAPVVLLGIITLLTWTFASCVRGPLTCLEPGSSSSPWNSRHHIKPQGYVAHALGEVDGIFYTNSRDALLLNYEKGFRTFEVDMVLLKDASVFCAHDGAEWMYGLDKTFAETTAEEMTGRLCLGKYTPLTGSGLLDLAYEYEDACFIIDTKRTAGDSNHEILRALVSEAKKTHPSVLHRMIPHTFGPLDLWDTSDIYPFRLYWVAVYSIRGNINGDSGLESDRVVLYAISNGGPAALRRTPHVRDAWLGLNNCALAALSPFPIPPSSLCDARLYISVDTIEGIQPSPE